MTSEDSIGPVPSRCVLLWERVKAQRWSGVIGTYSVLSSESQSTLRAMARERAIPTEDYRDWEDLFVLLALWEFRLPQDDPLAAKLRPLVNLTKDEIRERTGEWDPAPRKADVIESIIRSAVFDRARTPGQPEQPRQHSLQQTQHLPATDQPRWFDTTVGELRREVTERRIPWAMEEWRMGWRGPLIAHLLVADAVADDDRQHDHTVYKTLLPQVLEVVGLDYQEMRDRASGKKRYEEWPAWPDWSQDCPAKVIVRDMYATSSLLRPVSPPPTTRNPAPQDTAPGPSRAAQTATQAVVPQKRAHTESGGSSSSLTAGGPGDKHVTDGPPPAKRRTLPWNSNTTQPQPQPKPGPEPQEGVFSMTPSQLWEELDRRGIPHATDGKKTTNKAQLVARLLLHEGGVEQGDMFDRLLPNLEEVFGRRYAGMRAWAKGRNVSLIGLPYENREPLAKCIVQRMVEREVARVETANRMMTGLLSPMASLAFAPRGVGTKRREGS